MLIVQSLIFVPSISCIIIKVFRSTRSLLLWCLLRKVIPGPSLLRYVDRKFPCLRCLCKWRSVRHLLQLLASRAGTARKSCGSAMVDGQFNFIACEGPGHVPTLSDVEFANIFFCNGCFASFPRGWKSTGWRPWWKRFSTCSIWNDLLRGVAVNHVEGVYNFETYVRMHISQFFNVCVGVIHTCYVTDPWGNLNLCTTKINATAFSLAGLPVAEHVAGPRIHPVCIGSVMPKFL